MQIDGEEVTNIGTKGRDALMSKFGMLFQGGALFDSMKVWENIAFGLIQGKKMHRDKARIIAIEKLKQVGLAAGTADLFPAELSGGNSAATKTEKSTTATKKAPAKKAAPKKAAPKGRKSISNENG